MGLALMEGGLGLLRKVRSKQAEGQRGALAVQTAATTEVSRNKELLWKEAVKKNFMSRVRLRLV